MKDIEHSHVYVASNFFLMLERDTYNRYDKRLARSVSAGGSSSGQAENIEISHARRGLSMMSVYCKLLSLHMLLSLLFLVTKATGGDFCNGISLGLEWKCSTTDVCIGSHQRCNGEVDCPDRSDEMNCNFCQHMSILCENRRCSKPLYSCNGCVQGDWRCNTTGSISCIWKSQRCDGNKDCDDGSDEQNCAADILNTGSCHDSDWRCNNTKCISDSDRCNTEVDCDDGSDERNCVACKNGGFLCTNHVCIPDHYVCNQVNNCGDNSDEPESCFYRTNTSSSSNFWKTVGGIIGGGIGLLFLIIVIIVIMVVTYIRKRKRRQRQQQLQVMVIEGVEPIQHDDPENDHDQEHDSLIKKDSKEITEDAIEKGVAENRGEINWCSNVHLEY